MIMVLPKLYQMEVGVTSNENQLSEELDPMGNIRPSGIISKQKEGTS